MSQIITPATVNFLLCNGLAIYKGADWVVPVTVSDRNVTEGKIVDTPIDLTGLTGRCAIKKRAGDDAAVAIPTVEITDPVQGQFLISLSAEETASLIVKGKDWRDVTEYTYDLYLDDASTGVSYRALQGIVEISPSVVDGNDHEGE